MREAATLCREGALLEARALGVLAAVHEDVALARVAVEVAEEEELLLGGERLHTVRVRVRVRVKVEGAALTLSLTLPLAVSLTFISRLRWKIVGIVCSLGSDHCLLRSRPMVEQR